MATGKETAAAVTARLLDDRYEIGEFIESTGLFDVYSGVDTLLERPIEIKILAPEYARERGIRLRFRKEAQAATRLSHPSIVRVYATGEITENPDEPVPYVISAVPTGVSLDQRIAKGSVSTQQAVALVDAVLDALEYAHRAGLLHRNISTQNIFVSETGVVQVGNFGVARAVLDSSTTLSEATRALGSADYFSPEQAKGDPIDTRSDLYGVGAVLYELLTGRAPFVGSTPIAVAYQHINETPKRPSAVSDSATTLDRVTLHVLAKDPSRRYSDVAEFRSALQTAANAHAPSRHELDTLTADLYGPSQRNAAETARSLRQLTADTTMSRTQAGPPIAWVWSAVMVLAVVIASVLYWAAGIAPDDQANASSVTITDLTGDAYERAKAKLQAAGLEVERVEEPSTDVEAGRVTRTKPGIGATVKVGGKVEVWVSTGPNNVELPELVGVSRSDATNKLAQAGLREGPVTYQVNTAYPPLTVLGASVNGEAIQAGAILPQGTRVDLLVAAARTALPDMVGWEIPHVQTRTTDLGIVAVFTDDPECKATNPKVVSSMSHAPGDIDVNTEVTFFTCSGR